MNHRESHVVSLLGVWKIGFHYSGQIILRKSVQVAKCPPPPTPHSASLLNYGGFFLLSLFIDHWTEGLWRKGGGIGLGGGWWEKKAVITFYSLLKKLEAGKIALLAWLFSPRVVLCQLCVILSSWPGENPPCVALLTGSPLLTNWLNDWMTRPTDWLTNWTTDCLTDWLTYWTTDWLTDWLTYWRDDCLTNWLTDLLTEWPDWMTWQTDQLTDWLTEWMNEWIVFSKFQTLDFKE